MADWGTFLWGGASKEPDPANSRFGDRDLIMQQIQQGLGGVQGRQAPQSGNIQMGNVDYRNQAARSAQQGQQISQLQGIASGQQAGAGELAVNRQVQQALGAQQGAAMMQRGSAASTAGLGASRNMADIGIQGAGQAAQAQMADQGQAQQLLAQALGGARQQDIGVAQMQQNQIFQQAGLDQATSLANAQARLQMMGMNDQAAIAYLAQLTGMNAAEMQARLAQEGAVMGQQGLIGPLLQTAGTVGAAAAASDARLKRDIEDDREAVDELLDALAPYRFEYLDPKHGAGEHHGIMAQDLEQSRIGQSLLVEIDGMKHVDLKRALMASLGALARLNERLSKLEAAAA